MTIDEILALLTDEGWGRPKSLSCEPCGKDEWPYIERPFSSDLNCWEICESAVAFNDGIIWVKEGYPKKWKKLKIIRCGPFGVYGKVYKRGKIAGDWACRYYFFDAITTRNPRKNRAGVDKAVRPLRGWE